MITTKWVAFMTSKLVPSLTDFLRGDQFYERYYRLSCLTVVINEITRRTKNMNIILNSRRRTNDVRENVRHRKFSNYKMGSKIFIS